MGISIAFMSFFLACCVSQSTTEIDDLSSMKEVEDLGHLAFEMPEYPPHPDPSQARRVSVTPTIAVQAFGGYILGTHRGEWGGELAFRNRMGATEVLLHEPVQAIEAIAEQYLAFVGLAHLGLTSGAVYRVAPLETGGVKLELVTQLNGAPMRVGRGENGDVVFLTASGRYERSGLRAIPIFDCFSLGVDLAIKPISCAIVRAAR